MTTEQGFIANQENVQEIMEYLLMKTDEFNSSKEGKVLLLDLFMGVHSFHKMILMMIAEMWEANGGIAQDKTFKLADENWRIAMKECIRTYRSIPVSPDGPKHVPLTKMASGINPRRIEKLEPTI